ncbi:Ppx/GppA family phosphatase [Cetobacterium sp. 2A]|uniref:Ppx/GppA phosphatase family protein n=1 Tax=unclassified Cetobacterium TaxID=2630983 RepID=UPI00163B8633|nr:Ppx/GppA phosphatase family protein [Cetobacterium sp. 2A]MBC2857300.1 Ppx/GppA family phosphatase [Cetobacterium sp. 2A]
MKRVAIIDVGSNSVRLVIFHITKSNGFFPIEDIKETIRLGEDIHLTGEIKDTKIQLAFETLELFKGVCSKYKVDEIVAFGTAALRIGSNADILLDKVKADLNIDIKVISGVEEAFYSFTGALNSLDISEGLVMDMGGSSTELLWFKDRKPFDKISLDFGSVTFGEIGNIKECLSLEDEKNIRNFVKNELNKIPWLKNIEGLPLIGVGGVVRSVANVHLNMTKYPLQILHNYKMTSGDVLEVLKNIKDLDYKQKCNLQGLSKSRADLFSGATVAISEILDFSKLKNIIISGNGVREGFLFTKLNEYGRKITNVFDDSLSNILEYYDVNIADRDNTYHNFIKIMNALTPFENVDSVNTKITKLICYLDNIGIKINYYNQNSHSFYTILNSGIKGMEHWEIIYSALLAGEMARKKNILSQYSKLLTKDQIKNLAAVSKILKISDILNKFLNLNSSDFDIFSDNKKIHININKKSIINPKIMDMYLSDKKFKDIFGKTLEVR